MIIEGLNAVSEALNGDITVEKLHIQKGVFQDRLNSLVALARKKKIRVLFYEKEAMDRLSPSKKHQGAIAMVTDFVYTDFETMLEDGEGSDKPILLVLLEGIEDPHNLGAIIRVCDSVGATGIVIPKHRSVTVNDTVIRTSAGAAAHVAVAKVININDAVRKLKERDIKVYAADMDGVSAYGADFTGDTAIIIGGEGHGVNTLTRKLADGVVSLPQLGKVNSLNASVACGALLYEAVRQRQIK